MGDIFSGDELPPNLDGDVTEALDATESSISDTTHNFGDYRLSTINKSTYGALIYASLSYLSNLFPFLVNINCHSCTLLALKAPAHMAR